MLKKFGIILSIILIVAGLFACGGKKHPKNMVGSYRTYGVGYAHELMQLYENGRCTHRFDGPSAEGEWWVDNQVLYFNFNGTTYQYDLKIAQQDIEYELENKYKDLSPSEKSQLRLNFRFRRGTTMYFVQ